MENHINVDVVIAGTGVAGLFTALHLVVRTTLEIIAS